MLSFPVNRNCIGYEMNLPGIFIEKAGAVRAGGKTVVRTAAGVSRGCEMEKKKMRKRLLAWLLAAVVAIQGVFLWNGQAVSAEEPAPEDLYAKSACLLDGDSGRVLYGKDETVPLPMASTTKIMTCIVALEQGDMQQVVTASARAAGQPKVHLGIQEGQQFIMEDLLYALMLESFNDAAVMIAEGVAGSVEAFAGQMNQKAEEIGCKNTHFVTPNGLDASDDQGEHHTTAADLALIMRYCIRQSPKAQKFLAVTQTDLYTFWDVEHTQVYTCSNHNSFLQMMDGALSGKTGFTSKAGYCYVGALERDGKCLIVALLACGWPNNRSYKWTDTRLLMEYGLENYQYRDVFLHDWTPGEVEVSQGQYEGILGETAASVPLKLSVDPAEETLELLLKEEEKVKVTARLPKVLEAPVAEGKQVGEVVYTLEGEEIASYPVYTGERVEKIDFSWCLEQVADRYELMQE